MAFYSSIAPWYDRIFPFDQEIVPFLPLDRVPVDAAVLDIGCATGKLCGHLGKKGLKAVGIDLDPELIAIARTGAAKKAAGQDQFQILDMLGISQAFAPSTFHLVTCLGNTLVHVESPERLETMCCLVREVLHQDGFFVGQIINYDRILRHRCRGLPPIRNRYLTFERGYHHDPESGMIDFATRLSIKDPPQVLENHIPQLPITSAMLKSALIAAGFRQIEFFADYQKTPFHEEAYPLIWSATGGKPRSSGG